MQNRLIILSGIGIIQSILFSLLLAQKKNKKFSDWILISWFLIFSIHLLLLIVLKNNPSNLIMVLSKTVSLLHGPFFLFYTKGVFNQRLVKKELLHLLPFLLFTITIFLINQEASLIWEILLLITKILSLVIYPIYVIWWLNRKLLLLKTSRADNFILESTWVKTIAIILLSNATIGIIHVLVNILFNVQFYDILDIMFYVMIITIIGFYGIKFGIVFEQDIPVRTTSEKKKRYKNSPLKREETKMMRKRIDNFFEETNHYLNPDFSLSKLSSSLNIPKHHLSKIINLDIGSTFYDIVNAKRIQHAVQRISEQSDKNITLEGLGYECGFNTKASFFYHFKRYIGKTPGQFKSEMSID
ncbi:AraC family transcriptional regulator [Flavobacteriaceae bacterium PRS1]|nr:AraC family transcriptional regulator [Flavobacteriaceae bacterium PRS1]